MRIESEEQVIITFEQEDIGLDVYDSFDKICDFVSTEKDAEEGSFIFEANGVDLEVIIRRI